MNRPQKEQEITRGSFKYEIETGIVPCMERGGTEPMISNVNYTAKKCFELAQSYHKQESEKALREGEKELPDDGDIADMTMVNNESNYSDKEDVIFFEGAKRMRDKAAVIIAEKDALIDRLQYAETDKDNLIREREEEIRKLKFMINNGLGDEDLRDDKI